MNKKIDKKNIYIIGAFILAIVVSFSFGYYSGILTTKTEYDVRFSQLEKKLNYYNDEISKIQEDIPEINEEKDVKEIKMENKKKYDFETDNSLQKFVSSWKSFNDKSYVPTGLENISSEFVSDTKGGQVLREEANKALQKMGEKYFNDTGKKISVVSAYRSYQYQVGIKSRGCPDNLCAKAGFSEHQTGLVVDLWSASSNETWKNTKNLKEIFSWLNENAADFGFHNTYQKGLEIDGYEIEPWHWRYLGVELAKYLKENNLTIAEYYKSLKEKNG